MICGNCGANNADDARHCGSCGNPLYPSKKPNNKQAEYIIVYLIIAIAVLAVAITGVYIYKRNNTETNIFRGGGGGGGTFPTIYTPSPTKTPEPESQPSLDMNRINNIITQDTNHADISVCIIDLENDREYITDNCNVPMSASALVNIPILYTVSKELESGSSRWNTPVRFTYRFSGRGSLKQAQSNTSFPLSSLVIEMLNYSDNNATNSLIDYYDKAYISSVCRDNSYRSVDIQRYIGESNTNKDNYISAADTAKMLAELYSSDSADGIDADYLKSNFRILDSARDTGIGKYIPSHATFLNHNAVTSSIYNEVAIVSGDNATYVIAYLSNGGEMESSAHTAGEISHYVYNTLTKQR